MASGTNCRNCGAPLTYDVRDGVCPKCLLQQALASQAKNESTNDSPYPSTLTEAPGTGIGRYKLIEKIGEGGFGVVYMAEQEEPVRRLVALKIIKSGMDTKEVIARFEAERQALALMDHPNIAKVFDGGATGAGRPYFVMDLVKGIPLVRFCDEHCLSVKDRLDLFMQVCQAVQHAHQKGIIHRDLKPSNVMVALYDGRPVPKVIDFGVAKAMGQPLTDRTLHTRYGALVGTLEYMSPEQAELNQLDIDTRSDIYSLGVLLYELLTGTTPLTREALQQRGLEEMLRRVREEDPPSPSLCLSTKREELATISAQRKLEPEKLTKVVRGELDWIVMKALEKDRNRRYETAAGLAADLQRYQNDEPVIAGPPTVRYRVKKFVRKHRAAMTVAASFLALLAVASVISTSLAMWAIGAHDREVKERRRAEQALERESSELYRNQISRAQHEWENGHVKQAQMILDECAPRFRQWEWYYLRSLGRGKQLLPELPLLNSVVYEQLCLALTPNGRRLFRFFRGQDLEDREHRLPSVWRGRSRGRMDAWQTSLDGSLQQVGTWTDAVVSCLGSNAETVALVTSTDDPHTNAHWRLIILETQHFSEEISFPLTDPQNPPRGDPTSIAISPDGKLAAVGFTEFVPVSNRSYSGQFSLHVWDLKTSKRLCYRTYTWEINTLAFSPDSKLLAVSIGNPNTLVGPGGSPFEIEVYDCRDLYMTFSLTGHDRFTTSLAFSTDSQMLASSGQDRTVRFWSLETRQELFRLNGHQDAVRSIAFNHDGTLFASAAADNKIIIWDLKTRQPLRVIRGHDGIPCGLAFSPDDTTLYAGELNGLVKGWDITRDQEALVVSDALMRYFGSFDFSPEGRRMLALANISTSKSNFSSVVSWMTDGTPATNAITAPNNSGPHVLFLNFKTAGQAIELEEAYRFHASVAKFSPKGDRIVYWDGANGPGYRDAESGAVLKTNSALGGSSWHLTCSPDGKTILTIGDRGVVGLDARALTELSTLSDPTATHATGIEFSPKGDFFATAFFGLDAASLSRLPASLRSRYRSRYSLPRVTLRNTSTGEVIQEFSGGGRNCAISRMGTYLVSGNNDGSINVWNLQTMTLQFVLKGHSKEIESLAFTPDGQRLASAGRDRIIKIWDMKTGKEVLSLRGHTDSVGCVAFNPDGIHLVSSASDGTCRVWSAWDYSSSPKFRDFSSNVQ